VIPSLLAVTAVVTTLAGVPATPGYVDGAANVALFNKPTEIAIDTANGDVYVVDRLNKVVRKVGNGSVSTYLSYPDYKPATFDFGGPIGGGIVLEPPGDYPTSPFVGRGVFIADTGAHVLEQRDIYGARFGSHDLGFVGLENVPGAADGNPFPNKPMFNGLTAVTLDRRHYATKLCCEPRQIYIADTGNGSIRKVTREINGEGEYYASTVTTVARGFVAPRGLAVAPDGSLYVADAGQQAVIRVMPDGTSFVVAGKPFTPGNADGVPGMLNVPTGIDVDDAGNVYIADTGNHTIRRLTPDGVLETIAGSPGEAGYADGAARLARFNGPVGIQVAADGKSLIVADTSNHLIRKITFTASPPPQPRRRGVKH
jgi:hypothetical protein